MSTTEQRERESLLLMLHHVLAAKRNATTLLEMQAIERAEQTLERLCYKVWNRWDNSPSPEKVP